MPVAAIAGGLLAAGGSIYAANKQSNLGDKQIANQNNATQQSLAFQQQAFQQQQQNLAPYLQAGYGALSQLQQQFGLTNANGQQPGQPDWALYEQQNPDIAARGNEAQLAGEFGPGKQWASKEDWYAWHNQTPGEGRPIPTVQPTAANTNTPQQAGNFSTQRETYTRPDTGAAPAMPDLSASAYQQSPGYQSGLLAGQRNLNANFAARGLLGSGAGAEAAIKFGTDYQNQDYNNWRNNQLAIWQQQLNQYNQDRATTNANFTADRAYGTGVYDADRGYNTQRYDQNTANLFGLVNAGNPSQANALLQNNANTQAGLLQTSANNLSGLYGQQAQNAGGLAGNLVGIGQGLLGNINWSGLLGKQTSTTPPIYGGYNLGWGS